MPPAGTPAKHCWHLRCSGKAVPPFFEAGTFGCGGARRSRLLRIMPTPLTDGHGRSTGLVDVLDRVLDKGLVVAGDIKVSLAEVELLTIRIRLLICSIDKAEQTGLDWGQFDHHLSPGKQALSAENEALRKQVRALERQLAATRRRAVPGALR